jgi:hypothetical protein
MTAAMRFDYFPFCPIPLGVHSQIEEPDAIKMNANESGHATAALPTLLKRRQINTSKKSKMLQST